MKAHRPFTLQEHNPEWKDRFLGVAERIRPILGSNLVDVEHVGSTSIMGMVAKPQIDVLVVVKDLSLVEQLRGSFEEADFTVHGRGYVTDDDFYVSEDSLGGMRMTSIHILQEGNPKIKEYIVFRDYLTENVEDKELYIKTKRDLYSQHSENYASYDSGKGDVIQDIKQRAKEWAKHHKT